MNQLCLALESLPSTIEQQIYKKKDKKKVGYFTNIDDIAIQKHHRLTLRHFPQRLDL